MSSVGMLHGCGAQVQTLGWVLNCAPSIPKLGKLALLNCLDRGEGLYPLYRRRFLFIEVDAGCFVIEGDSSLGGPEGGECGGIEIYSLCIQDSALCSQQVGSDAARVRS